MTDIEDGTTVTIDPALDVLGLNALFGLPRAPFTSDSAYVLSVKGTATTAGPIVATRIADQKSVVLTDINPVMALPAAYGSTLAVGDNLVFNGQFPVTSDLRIWDLASGAAPRLVATGANFYFFLNRSRTALVYASNASGSAGLRVTSVF